MKYRVRMDTGTYEGYLEQSQNHSGYVVCHEAAAYPAEFRSRTEAFQALAEYFERYEAAQETNGRVFRFVGLEEVDERDERERALRRAAATLTGDVRMHTGSEYTLDEGKLLSVLEAEGLEIR